MSSIIPTSTTILLLMMFSHQTYAYVSDLKLYHNMVGVSLYNHFYTWNDISLSWIGAKTECKRQGGYLAVIENEIINSFIFRAFFQQSVLMANSYIRNTLMNKSRIDPPFQHRTSKVYHTDEAWMGGIKTKATSGELQWVWLSGEPFEYNNPGTGFEKDDWNCLSVKPGHVTFSDYELYWYGTDCLTPLPFICQFEKSDNRTTGRSNMEQYEEGEGSHTDKSSSNYGVSLISLALSFFIRNAIV